jgi:putative flippase GtrA
MNGRGLAIQRAAEELLTVSRFSLVGIAAAGIHIGIVWILIAQTDISVLIANFVAFLVAFGFSFIGQYFWTFRSTSNLRRTLLRFFSVALGAFITNNLILVVLLNTQLLDDLLAAVFAVFVIPLITYLAGRFWAFG